ncbi:MAG TPA: hypothetical protein VIK01_06340 [Polyangiaceae bacterium]
MVQRSGHDDPAQPTGEGLHIDQFSEPFERSEVSILNDISRIGVLAENAKCNGVGHPLCGLDEQRESSQVARPCGRYSCSHLIRIHVRLC